MLKRLVGGRRRPGVGGSTPEGATSNARALEQAGHTQVASSKFCHQHWSI